MGVMLRVLTMQARPGMELALPIVHPGKSEVMLLRAGVILDARSISRLHELGIHELWIRYPALEGLVSGAHPVVQAEYRRLCGIVGRSLNACTTDGNARLDFHGYRRAVLSVVECLVEHPGAASLVSMVSDAGSPAADHAANVCVLSLMMGMKLEFYLVRERARIGGQKAKAIAGLGLGAILHDVGMFRLPAEVRERWNAKHDETDEAWRMHAQIGYEMVRSEVEATAAVAVLHHHQRFDGSGFPAITSGLQSEPRTLAGSDIHIFARLIAVADVYDRMRRPHADPGCRDSAPAMSGVRALRLIREGPLSRGFDPLITLALLAAAPPYPVGSMVTLSDGSRAVVVNTHQEDPCRPTVETLRNGSAAWFKEPGGERIDLRGRLDLEVAEMDGFDTLSDNFYPLRPGELDLACAYKAATNRLDALMGRDANQNTSRMEVGACCPIP